MHAATQSPTSTSNAPGVACGDLVVHWERGYRCHGLWRGNQRLARVSLGHPSFWKAGRDAYSWETDVRPFMQGSAMTLKAAKKAAENSLHNSLLSQPETADNQTTT